MAGEVVLVAVDDDAVNRDDGCAGSDNGDVVDVGDSDGLVGMVWDVVCMAEVVYVVVGGSVVPTGSVWAHLLVVVVKMVVGESICVETEVLWLVSVVSSVVGYV